MNTNLQANIKETDSYKNDKVSFAIWSLFVGLVFCFSNNHNALGIANYFLFLLLFVVGILIKRRWTITLHPLMFSLAIMLLVSIRFFYLVEFGTLASYLIWFAVILVAITYSFNKKELSVLMWGFILGAAIFAILVIVMKYDYYSDGRGRYTVQLWNNEKFDPNFLAAFLFVGATFALHTLLHERKTILKLFAFAFFLTISYAITMTGSRAAFLGLLIASCGPVLQIIKPGKKTIIFSSAGFLALFAVFMLFPDIVPVDLGRFDPRNLADSSNALRIKFWKATAVCFFNRPLLGYGSIHGTTVMEILTKLKDPCPHNTIFSLLLNFGLIGTIPFLALLWKIFNRYRKLGNFEWMFFFFGFLFVNLIISNHMGISFWIPLMIFHQVSIAKLFKVCS